RYESIHTLAKYGRSVHTRINLRLDRRHLWRRDRNRHLSGDGTHVEAGVVMVSCLRFAVFQFGVVAAMAALASSTVAEGPTPRTGQSVFITVPSQPINAGDAKAAALAYHDSGAYQQGLEAVAAQAIDWLKIRAGAVQRPALVLDIDETALSNWEILKRDDFGRPIDGPCDPATNAPCGWAAWDQ